MSKIGNVYLDETHYSGKDLYSDGDVEEHILKLAEEYGQSEYHKIITEERDWPVMYHLAHERGNILSWYPFCKNAKILEVGSGCGAITGTLAANAGSVTCIDLSKRRSTINALRNQERDNIKICIGNFQDIEKDLERDFDYATLIGVFEYGQGYIGGEKPYHEFLTTVMEHLRPGGKLLLAIENRFGLKYWAGCTEDHVGRMFEGIEGYPGTQGVRTFTRQELIQILEDCGYEDYRFYYPHPDYKIPLMIYSDHYLPQKGALMGNFCNFDRPRLALMDEGKVYDQILEHGLFGLYANSYFVEITKKPAEKTSAQVIYTKYSNGRAPEFAMQTRIARDEAGEPQIYKVPEFEKGQEHICHIAEAAQKLSALWKEKGMFKVNECRLEGDKVYFEYLRGVTLEERLDKLLEHREMEQVMDEIQKAVDRILHAAAVTEFQLTPEFRQVFGEVQFPDGTQAVETADIDMIFSNLLLLDGEDAYHVLDYEWTFFFPVPVEFMVYRALHYYLEGASKRWDLGEYVKEYAKLHPREQNTQESVQEENNDERAFREFYGYFGISRKMQWTYAQMEQNFQKYMKGGYASLCDLYRMMGKASLRADGILQEAERRRIQVYLDFGEGFSEKNSYYIDQLFGEKAYYEIPVPEGTKIISVDPALCACILWDVELRWEDGSKVSYWTTGLEIGKNCILFDNSDPKIIIEEIPHKKRQMDVSYKISVLEEGTAKFLMDKLNIKGKIKDSVRKLIKG